VRELRIGDGNLPLDGPDRYGKRLPVEIADGYCGRDQEGHFPTQSFVHFARSCKTVQMNP
jgi:hypothetical protein